MVQIALLNQSTVVSDDEVQKIMAALQVQVDRDWQPIWGSRADLIFVPKGQALPKDAWWLGFFDNSDQAGALGYHDLTDAGLPLGKVFPGGKISVTASHEVLEMLGDPDTSRCVVQGTMLYALEVSDAVEAEGLGYDIDGVTVSNFVTPAYFEGFRKDGPFDFCKVLKAPLSLAPGGYMLVLDMNSTTGWQQKFAASSGDHAEFALHPAHYAARPRLGSRRERRRTLRQQWVFSRPAC